MSRWTDFKETLLGAWLVGTLKWFDRLVNGCVHGDFEHTTSAWLGKNNPDCPLCRWLSRNVEEDHCTKAARAEGLIE